MPAINRWNHITEEELIELVKKHRTISAFTSANGLPDYRTVLKKLKQSKWSELLQALGIAKNPVGVYNRTKPTLFYVLKCIDDNGTKFLKYGVTQGSLGSRYKAYVDNYEVLFTKTTDLDTAQNLQSFCEGLTEYKYIPECVNFQASRHGGFSECLLADAAFPILSKVL